MVAAGSLVAAGMGLADAVNAQTAAKDADRDRKAASAKPDAAAAQKLVENGISALEAGRVDNAVTSLSSAIGSGSLPAPQMARALYYRGVAYRKQGKPALAIADLTSALWLRGGLTGSLRQEALQARAAAYREAGLPDPSASDAVRTAAAPAGSDGETKAPAPAEIGSQSAADGKTTVSVASGGTFSGVNNFFNSLLGLGASASAPSAPPTAATASTPAPAPPVPPASATSSWRQATEVKVAAAEAKRPVSAKTWSEATTSSIAPAGWSAETSTPPVRPVAVAAAQKEAVRGRYRLQVAAVRSQAEAQALAARLREKHGADIAALKTEIDETVVGNMGTLYRVRLGPFANASEPRTLCAKLKSDGLDCLIVAQ